MELLKDKIVKLLNETETLIKYNESPRHANASWRNCRDLDKGITLKTWCNGCRTVFVFKDGQEIGSIDNFSNDLWDLERVAKERISNNIINSL